MIRTDLAADQRCKPAETHGTDFKFVRIFQNIFFKLRQLGIRIYIVERAEQLLFGKLISGRAVSADRNTDNSDAASLSLRLPDSV